MCTLMNSARRSPGAGRGNRPGVTAGGLAVEFGLQQVGFVDPIGLIPAHNANAHGTAAIDAVSPSKERITLVITS